MSKEYWSIFLIILALILWTREETDPKEELVQAYSRLSAQDRLDFLTYVGQPLCSMGQPLQAP